MSKAIDIFTENDNFGVFLVEKKDNPQKNEAFLCYGIYKKGDFYEIAVDSPEYSNALKDKKFYASDHRGIPHLAEYLFDPDAAERFYVFKTVDDMEKWQKDEIEEMKKPEIDNFKQISEILKFETEDDFYLVELIIRKKDHPENTESKSQQKIGEYWIDSEGKLEKLEDEIKSRCNFSRCRAYVNPSVKSYKKACFATIEKLLERIKGEDYRKFQHSALSAASSTGSRDNWWIVDVDTDFPPEKIYAVRDELDKISREARNGAPEEKHCVAIKTPNGWHLLLKPFKMPDILDDLGIPGVEVKKNASTVLYVPSFQN